MRVRDLLKLSTRTFRTRLGRTALTILGISVGIGAILIFVSLGYGLQHIMLEQVTTDDSLLTLDVTTSDNTVLPLNNEKIAEISKIPNVDKISPIAILSGQVTFNNLTSDVLFYACDPSYFKLGGISAQNGVLFDGNSKKAVLSSMLLKSFNIDPAQAVGKDIQIVLFKSKETLATEESTEIEVYNIEEPYKISGTIEDETTSYIYLPLSTLTELNIDNYNQAKVRVSSSSVLDVVREKIVTMGYFVSALSESIDEANKIFGAIQVTLAAFGLVALIVAAIGMANTMTVTLLERTNEIGIMKAIGATNKNIAIMFLTESMMMGFLGGLGGVVINYVISWLLNFGLNILAKGMGGQAIDLFLTPIWLLIFILVFSAFIGFISGIMPARKPQA